MAIDAVMWQNEGMCGLDHWNFVMHPVDTAMTCDPNGSYARTWCPELAAVPDDFIHKPYLEERSHSLQDVKLVRRHFGEYVDPRSGCDLAPPGLGGPGCASTHCFYCIVSHEWSSGGVVNTDRQFLLSVITRMEFKHQSNDPDPDAASNPHVSRRRDETITFLNQTDFMASMMNEGRERQERDQRKLEGLAHPHMARGRVRRTPAAKARLSSLPGGVATFHR
ncbi:uncharacterized protein [Salvelinus sp. IW2-2015]|uniref:uncharacterized protein isoform X2 n=1 Tax=Salvelinus sp. IW2-2015 TaxID=2691554 RepID=UPI0038D40566